MRSGLFPGRRERRGGDKVSEGRCSLGADPRKGGCGQLPHAPSAGVGTPWVSRAGRVGRRAGGPLDSRGPHPWPSTLPCHPHPVTPRSCPSAPPREPQRSQGRPSRLLPHPTVLSVTPAAPLKGPGPPPNPSPALLGRPRSHEVALPRPAQPCAVSLASHPALLLPTEYLRCFCSSQPGLDPRELG